MSATSKATKARKSLRPKQRNVVKNIIVLDEKLAALAAQDSRDDYPKKKHGRPQGTLAKIGDTCTPEVIAEARRLAECGCYDFMISCALGVGRETAITWAKKHPEFKQAIIDGRAKYCARLVEYKDQILRGEADPFKYPEVRRKAIDSSIQKMFPEAVQQQYLVLQTPENTVQTKAEEQFQILREMLDIGKPAIDECVKNIQPKLTA